MSTTPLHVEQLPNPPAALGDPGTDLEVSLRVAVPGPFSVGKQGMAYITSTNNGPESARSSIRFSLGEGGPFLITARSCPESVSCEFNLQFACPYTPVLEPGQSHTCTIGFQRLEFFLGTSVPTHPGVYEIWTRAFPGSIFDTDMSNNVAQTSVLLGGVETLPVSGSSLLLLCSLLLVTAFATTRQRTKSP